MSSALPIRRPLTLRARLLLTVAAVSTAASLVVGASAVLALRAIATEQVDAQLVSAEQRSVAPFPDGPDGPAEARDRLPDDHRDGVGDQLQRPGQAAGTLVAQVDTRTDPPVVSAAVLDEKGIVQPIGPEVAQVLATARTATTPVTVELPGLGDYRVLADAARTGTTLTGLPLSAVQATAYRLAGAVALVTLLGLGLVLAAGAGLLRVALRPLDRVRATAVRVSEQPLDRGEVALAERVPNPDPHTEVGQVATALNRMLEHVAGALQARQTSELRLRRFVADASHELRTPLASVRGYAELMRRRPESLPGDVAHALGRVESEAIRMGGLVEDMLLLARLDEGRPLAPHPLDLGRVVVDAVGDARVAGPEHRWELRVPDGRVRVIGDAARLTQVVVNLLANARTHTPPGTRVSVDLAIVRQPTADDPDGEHAVLVVADDGPGMPAELAAEAFERFTRGDSSRSRAAGSTGLGLSIVEAVILAHGGRVRLDSVPGAGTKVTVRLPLAGVDAAPEAASPDAAPVATAVATTH